MKFLISARKYLLCGASLITPGLIDLAVDNIRLSVVGRFPCASWPIFRAQRIDHLESSWLFERRDDARRDTSHVARNGPRHGREFYRKPISAFPSTIRSSVRSTYLHGYGVLFEIALSRIMQYFSFYRERRKGRHVREAVEGNDHVDLLIYDRYCSPWISTIPEFGPTQTAASSIISS